MLRGDLTILYDNERGSWGYDISLCVYMQRRRASVVRLHEGAAVLQVLWIWAYLTQLHGGAGGQTIALAEGNELLPEFSQGRDNSTRMPSLLGGLCIIYGKPLPGEPRAISLDSPGAGSYRRTATSEISLNY